MIEKAKKLKIYILMVLSFFVTSCVTEKDEPVWSLGPGDRLPDFSIVMDNGDVVTTSSLSGKKSIIIFFTTTCGDCRRELPAFQQWYDEIIQNQENVNFICISRAEGSEAVAAYWAEHGFTMPYSAQSDRKVYEMFASSGVPRVYEINPELIITNVISYD